MPALILSIFTAFSAWLSASAGSIIGIIVSIGLFYIALKVLLFLIFGVALPMILYNLFTIYSVDILNYVIEIASGFLSPGALDVTIQITGFAGWIFDKLQVVQAVTIALSASVARFIMSMIPGLR